MLDTIQAILQSLFDWIDRQGDLSDPTRYALYWLATLVLIVVLANIASWIRFQIYLKLPSLHSRTRRRDTRATKIALTFFPDSNMPRTSLALQYSAPAGLTKSQERRWRKGRQLSKPCSAQSIQGWARSDYRRERMNDLTTNLCRTFGGIYPATLHPGVLFRPAVILLAVALVVWARPPAEISVWFARARDSVWQALSDNTLVRLLPFAILVVALLIVLRPTPLVDRIRARDEAAKDANKLLGEMFGALQRLGYGVAVWKDSFDQERHALVDAWVKDVTSDEYEWRYEGGVVRIDDGDTWRVSFGREPRPKPPADLETAIVDLVEIQHEIFKKGLGTVAARLTLRVRSSASRLRLLTVWPSGDLQANLTRELHLPESLAPVEDRKGFTIRNIYEGRSKTEGRPFDRQHLERKLEEGAFGLAEFLDYALLEIASAELAISRLERFLNARMLGSWWTRALSVVQK